MKKMMVCLVIMGFVISGCTGSFNVTKNIYQIHRSQENQWVDEVVFLAFVIVPVYGIGMLADGVIFNTVEFWSGENPITVSMNDSSDEDVILERSAKGVVAKDKIGLVLYTSIKDAEGGVSVYDGDEMLVRYFSPEEVQSERSRLYLN
ncbi:MAG: DUF3332 family protein [Desulfobacteraceae bacterium]|nr:DUF3332 family protein [Desulfobacteraceae bacterium]MBC2758171.1 DUF3332 family protein [Desulfobacteraceae bacterium]